MSELSRRHGRHGPGDIAGRVVPRSPHGDSAGGYGWKGDTDIKPDLTVDYVFYEQRSTGLRFFNKLETQSLNAKTLGETFNGSFGAVAAGMTVPLAAFPPGEFEVTVRILDKRTQASATQKVRFFVVG